jgi:NADPH2:quinone reductase
MRALVMTGPSLGSERTEVREIREPRPGPGQVTIDVINAGINFLDVMERRGDARYVRAWPHLPGHEAAGTVREVGAGVDNLSVGQRVAGFVTGGGLAQVALARAALTVPVPDQVPLSVAAAAPLMLSTALLLLTDAARFSPGDSVLVHSASGGVGSAVAQLVPILGGGLLIGTVGRADKAPSARNSGYDFALTRGDNLAAAVRAAAGGGVDIVLDPLGTSMLDVDLDVVAAGGRVVLFGNAGGGDIAPLPPIGRLQRGNIALSRFSISALSATAPERAAAALRRILSLVASHELVIAVTEIDSLAGVPAIHDLLAESRGQGKYVTRLASTK